MSITYSEARKVLPKFAIGLAMCTRSLANLRLAVRAEIDAYIAGENPLSKKQLKALEDWLAKTK